jgi:hypothetical protein
MTEMMKTTSGMKLYEYDVRAYLVKDFTSHIKTRIINIMTDKRDVLKFLSVIHEGTNGLFVEAVLSSDDLLPLVKPLQTYRLCLWKVSIHHGDDRGTLPTQHYFFFNRNGALLFMRGFADEQLSEGKWVGAEKNSEVLFNQYDKFRGIDVRVYNYGSKGIYMGWILTIDEVI